MLIYTSEWASCSQVQMALQDLGYTCVERTAVGDAAAPGDRFLWKRGDRTIVQVGESTIFEPWKHPALLGDALQRVSLLYVTGGGRERKAVSDGGRVAKVLVDREILPSEAVCVFEIGLRNAR